MSWCSIIVIGALSRADRNTFETWLPFFEAFEAGAFSIAVTANEICVARIPERVCVDDRRRLHSADGPAFKWLDDVSDHYWHGVFVPERVIMQPETISVREIESERNAEIRRVMMERFGQQRFFAEAKFDEVQSDDWGTLLRKHLPGDDPILVVKLINSTEEPDGTFKNYFLRVDERPGVRQINAGPCFAGCSSPTRPTDNFSRRNRRWSWRLRTQQRGWKNAASHRQSASCGRRSWPSSTRSKTTGKRSIDSQFISSTASSCTWTITAKNTGRR
jgi:hypothetical protein